MPLSEGYCTLEISYNGETAFWRVHPVEIWSFLIRYNPGQDGYPKQFFITFEETEAQKLHNSSLSADFQDLLSGIFYNKELALFSSWAEATTDFFHMEIPQTKFDDLEFTLVSKDLAQELPTSSLESGVLSFDRSLLYKIPIFDSYMNVDFTLPERDFFIADKGLVEEFITKNENLLEFMKADIRVTSAYDRDASIFRHSYDAADFIATITLLKLIDTPIKKNSMHMGNIQKWNDSLHTRLNFVRELLYPGFVVTDENSNSAVLAEIINPVELIVNASKNDSRELYFDVFIHDAKNTKNHKGYLEVDSKGLQIIKDSLFEEQIVFKSFLNFEHDGIQSVKVILRG